MASFEDTQGRKWHLSIDINTIRRVRTMTGFDLYKMVEFGNNNGGTIRQLTEDVILLVDVLYAIVKPDADQAGITDEEFGAALGGDVLGRATEALLDAYINFCPSRQSKILTAIRERLTEKEQEAEKALAAYTEDRTELDRAIDAAIEASGSSS